MHLSSPPPSICPCYYIPQTWPLFLLLTCKPLRPGTASLYALGQQTIQWGPNFCLGHCHNINYNNWESQVCFGCSWTITKSKPVDYKHGRSLLSPDTGVSPFCQGWNNSSYFSFLNQQGRSPVGKHGGPSPRFSSLSWAQSWEVPQGQLHTPLLVQPGESHPPGTS